mgnify:CR=1 FL=1
MSSNENLGLMLRLQRIQLMPGWLKLLALLILGLHLVCYLALAFYWFQPYVSDAVNISIERSFANFILVSACFVVVLSSIWGLIQGYNWGLNICIFLVGISMFTDVFALLNKSEFDLMLIFEMLLLWRLIKLHLAWSKLRCSAPNTVSTSPPALGD